MNEWMVSWSEWSSEVGEQGVKRKPAIISLLISVFFRLRVQAPLQSTSRPQISPAIQPTKILGVSLMNTDRLNERGSL